MDDQTNYLRSGDVEIQFPDAGHEILILRVGGEEIFFSDRHLKDMIPLLQESAVVRGVPVPADADLLALLRETREQDGGICHWSGDTKPVCPISDGGVCLGCRIDALLEEFAEQQKSEQEER